MRAIRLRLGMLGLLSLRVGKLMCEVQDLDPKP